MHDRSKPRVCQQGRTARLCLGGWVVLTLAGGGATLTPYGFGDPKAEEQLYVELINRARANPTAEGLILAATTDLDVLFAYNYYSVNLNQMKLEFSNLWIDTVPSTAPVLSPLPPLAPNASLTSAARGHSAWMLAAVLQEHNESPTNTPTSRITAAGYVPTINGENIFAATNSAWHGHAGFEVDWGTGAYGMQTGRGHRANIHDSRYREIGVGVTFGTNGTYPGLVVGPQLVTQEFASSSSNPALATGVAYYDLNANHFYDLGEGISGLTVNVSGADVTQYCVTATGGGWVVPVPPTAATRTVTFSGLNMNQNVSLVVPAAMNAKADLQLAYASPVITSSTSAALGVAHTLSFTAVGGASAYIWIRGVPTAAAGETCDSLANVTTSTTGTYSVLNSSVKQQGSYAFHLENTIAPGASQSIQLNPLYFAQTAPTLTFQSRVRYATTDEKFKVQVREEGGLEWQDVHSQTGTGTSGETVFSAHSNIALTGMAGKAFRVRFLLNYTSGGGYYGGSSGDLVGWFIDAISFTNVSTLTNCVSQNLAVTNGSFTPAAGTYLMSVAPVITNRNFPASYQTLTVTNKTPATVTLGNLAATYNGSPKPATATTAPVAGLPVNITYNGSATAPVSGGSYTVVGTINDPTYQGSATGTLVVAKAAASVTLGSLAATYTGSAKSATATTLPVVGLAVDFTYNASSTAPVSAGTYAVVGTINDINYQGSASATLVVAKAAASVTLGSLAAIYNGSPKSATATTSPAGGLTVDFTYNGSATAPVSAGTYAVVGTINDTNYQGSATGTLVIAALPSILSQPVSPTITKSTSTTLTVIASGALTFQWYVGASGVVTNPIPNANAASYTTPILARGTYTYWVRVGNDAGHVNSRTATVIASNSTITRSFAVWASEIETANSLAANSIKLAPQADFDRDGRSNLLEYAFGSAPNVGNDAAPRMPVDKSTPTTFVLGYQRDTALTDLTFTSQACLDLANWKAPLETGAPAGFEDLLITTTNGTLQTREARIPKSTGNCFMRMRVIQP